MQNPLYIIDSEGRQIEPELISMNNGVIESVTAIDDEMYSGDEITVRTPRDFINVSDLNRPLTIGDEIFLDNQSLERWTVRQGWYEVDGNPAIYGWYLESIPVGRIRSFYMKDLNSLTFVTPLVQFDLPDVEEV